MSVFPSQMYIRVLGGDDTCSECAALAADSPHVSKPGNPHPNCKCTVLIETATIFVTHLMTFRGSLHAEAISAPIPPGGHVDMSSSDTESSAESSSSSGTVNVGAEPFGVGVSGEGTTGREVSDGDSSTTAVTTRYQHVASVSDGWQRVFRFSRTDEYVYEVRVHPTNGAPVTATYRLEHTSVIGLGVCPVEGPYEPDFEVTPDDPPIPTPEDLGLF